jgi:hypothetical protein
MSSSQSKQPRELNRADTSAAPMTGENRFAQVSAQLDDLLEHGEISPEAFALYSTAADALSSALDSSGHTHDTAPTRFVEVDGFASPTGASATRPARRSCCSSTSWATSTSTTHCR